jgi:hypothetical protein
MFMSGYVTAGIAGAAFNGYHGAGVFMLVYISLNALLMSQESK